MIRSVPLLAACALLVSAVPALAQDGDIVVRARKLRDWRAVLVVGANDTTTCRIVRTTGDAELDARACAAQLDCYARARPDILATGRLRPRARARALAAVDRGIAACFGTVSRHIAAYPLED